MVGYVLVMTPRLRAVAPLVAIGLSCVLSSCGGVDRDVLGDVALAEQPSAPTAPPPSSAPEVGSTGTGVFTGDFADAPVVHQIDLMAGDGLRVWAKSTGTEMTDVDLAGPFADGLSIGVAVPLPLFEDLVDAEVIGNPDYRGNFFSDYGFDDDEPSSYTFDPDTYGALVHWTSGGGTAQFEASADPPLFTCAARGRDPDPLQGSWLVFVAPADGTYSIWMLGLGPYELHVDVNPAPKSIEVDAGEYPFAGDAWVEAVRAQYAFLFDASSYPPDQFVTEAGGDVEEYGPDVSAEDCAAPPP
jgi:hypothetical protein